MAFEAHRRLFEQRIRVIVEDGRGPNESAKVARTKAGRSENNENDDNELQGLHKSPIGDDGYCHCEENRLVAQVQKNRQANQPENGSYHLDSCDHLNVTMAVT